MTSICLLNRNYKIILFFVIKFVKEVLWMSKGTAAIAPKPKKIGNAVTAFFKDFAKEVSRNKMIYVFAIPILIFYIIFSYWPMYGIVIAFKEFNPRLGILGSHWVGLEHFKTFLTSYEFKRVFTNTLLISTYDIIWGFPAPIILALLLNEVKGRLFKRTVQTITYLPHFVSTVVICGIILNFTASDGLFNQLLAPLGVESVNFLTKPEYFRSIYVSSGIWQNVGFDTIIYLAAIAGIDQSLYEAAVMDGAGRFRKIWNVTIPSIAPTIIILFILRIGSLMNVGFEKILLLYNPLIYDTADVISTYVYRKGLVEYNFSFSTAIGLFNSVINFTLLYISNKLSNKVTGSGLW